LLKSRGFWLGILVSAVCIGLFVFTSDVRHPEKLRHAFSDVNYAWILASLPVYYLALWIRTIRWQYLLRSVRKVSAIRLYPVVIIGLMANNLIPARAGELARAYVLGQREKISKTTSLGTIAVDRLFDGITLVPILLIVGAFASGDTSFTVGAGPLKADLNLAALGGIMSALFGGALIVLFYLTLSSRGRRQLHNIIHRFAPASIKPKIEGMMDAFFDGLQVLRSPADLAVAWVMSFASWTLEALMYYLVARGFGIHEGFHIFLLLTAAVNLVIAIVATQGGVGPFELVVSKTIVAFGTGAAAGTDQFKALAEAYAIGLHAILLFPIVVIGLYLMWSMQFSFGDMLKSSRPGDNPPDTSSGDDPQPGRPARPLPAAEVERA
jgi:uncharacterized protein (TIRG00374 family)